ncbi:MAG: DUF89 family protein [bacterium]|nr:DUF89 family protein [bacterium]
MHPDHTCLFCFIQSFQNILEREPIENGRKKDIIQNFMKRFAEIDYERSMALVSRDVHALIRESIGNPDPFKALKQEFNELLLSHYSELQEKVTASADPFNTALRLAIGGNIIDFGSQHSFDVMQTLEQVLEKEFAIDDSKLLKEEIARAETILYLGDNAGEIVLDKLFIETMGHGNLYFAVRGGPVINDVTIEDARNVGMDRAAKVISSGYDAPSTAPEQSSPEFRELFETADLIISKGQGNYEGLNTTAHKNLFFLLMIKCDVVASQIGVPVKSFVAAKSVSQETKLCL